MELLAPAGNHDNFFTAIRAGANALYCGLDAFNARLRAKNFSIPMLASLIPYAHAQKVKIYVTLNTLIKEAELRQVCDILHQLVFLKVDGVIVTDPGLICLVRNWFPSLPLHASTQMFFHNSIGVEMAHRMGIKRVILARELTIDELKAISAKSKSELEVFVHGALCYSFSGVCLASSFLGGSSGNRGRCTQVCRRPFTTQGKTGQFFSPYDLSALDYIPQFKQMGISALKIEGRLRSTEYVHTVVSAYRRAIDSPESIPELKKQLRFDTGREKTSFFLSGTSQKNIIQTQEYAGTGLYLGTIQFIEGNQIRLISEEKLGPGDQLRIHPKSGYEGARVTVSKAINSENEKIVSIDNAQGFSTGDGVYLISLKILRPNLSQPKIAPVDTRQIPLHCPFVNRIFRSSAKHRQSPKEQLLVKIDDIQWIEYLKDVKVDGIVLSLDRESIGAWLTAAQQASNIPLIGCLPPFIPENELAIWREIIRKFSDIGIRRWSIGNVGQMLLFDNKEELLADMPVWIMNRMSQTAIRNLGFRQFSYSTEDDFPNMRAIASSDGIACVFGSIPLFISRIRPSVEPELILTDSEKAKFITKTRHNLYYLLSKQPFCIFQKRPKLVQSGICSFLIDLSFQSPDKNLLTNLLDSYHANTKIPDSTLFNFKLGLR